jgi:signal transduction histidine kinase/NO-binding membrane sensor protein with MHYT domain/ActR/RegA family two-component response regulator
MFTVLTCIYQQHDLRLVVVAALICLASSSAVFAGYRRATRAAGGLRFGWAGFTGLVGGSGVWATHFIAMLAYQPGLTIRYEAATTGLSLVLSVLAMSAGFSLAVWRQAPLGRAAGGALAGLGIGLMHFVGMAAVRTQADLIWRPGYVSAALIIGTVGAAAALSAGGSLSKVRQTMLGAGLLVIAICGLHFTAMTAVTLLPNPNSPLPAHFIDRSLLALAVAVLAGMILVAAAALFWMERFSSVATLSNLRDALDGAPSALAFFDNSHRLIFWNEGYGEVLSTLGLQPARGLAYRQILDSSDSIGARTPSADWQTRSTASMGRFAQDYQMPDGRWLRGELGSTRDGGLVAMFSDVTDQIETARVLAEAKAKAEAANQAKSDFLAMMSHEIRTPLNGILGMAQAMQADRPSPAQREQLKVIRRSGEVLLGVLNEILDLSKIESGELELEEVEFDLEHLVRGSLAAFQPQAGKKGVGMEFTLEEGAAGVFRGDEIRLRQILYNLLSNAVKFTEHGRIDLIIAHQRPGLCIRVTDTGIGMAPERMHALFDKFVQGDASTTRRFGGSGLGLSICRHLAELMGGYITAESVLGEGSAFTLTLPLVRVGEAAPTQDATPAGPQMAETRQTIRILAAEDNEVNQLVIRILLNQAGIEPLIVDNGAKALEAWRREAWDVILLDVQMPQMDGPTAAKAIRAEERETNRKRTPIIAVTANAMQHQLADYEVAGMDEVVTKPIDAARLYGALERALEAASAANVEAA